MQGEIFVFRFFRTSDVVFFAWMTWFLGCFLIGQAYMKVRDQNGKVLLMPALFSFTLKGIHQPITTPGKDDALKEVYIT